MLKNNLYVPWAEGDSNWGFEIVDGEYRGVVIHVIDVRFNDRSESNVDVEYNIIKKPDDVSDVDTSSATFINVIDLVINDILKEAVQMYEQSRDHDSQESSSQ